MALNRVLYCAALLGALVFHTYYTGWFSWYLLMLAVCLPVFSLLCSLPAMRSLRLQVQMDTHCQRGGKAQLAFRTDSRSRMPTPVYRFVLTRTDALTGEEKTMKLRLAARGSCVVQVPTAHCGSYRYTLSKGRVYDYLGLFWLPLRLPQPDICAVLPQAQPPKQIPNLSQFQSRSFRPKYGGGFSEIHELREYQPGDQMRDVHWKLSAKTEHLIVREPLEPNRGQVIISLDWSGGRQALDGTLDILMWLSGWLIGREVRHEVFWIDPDSFEPQSRSIVSQVELETLVKELLRTRLREGTPSIAGRSFPRADWRYHIHPEAGSEEVAAR